MNDLPPELLAHRRALWRRRRIVAGVALGNLGLLALLIGGPYLRGRSRAQDGRVAFARFAACLWGADPAPDPGLVLPEGERTQYVDAVWANPRWPQSCRAALRAVAPERTFWLLPDTRFAEDEVRRAVKMVSKELDAAGGPREDGASVPSRPRLASQRLSAALSLWMQAADADIGLEAPAIRLGGAASAVLPERIPYNAASDAETWVRPLGDGVDVLALDTRGISWVRVGGGAARPRRYRRPRLVRGTRFARGSHWLFWVTPESQCGESRCVGHALGLARLTEETAVVPRPRYVAAHPAIPIERGVSISDGALRVLARDEGRWELRSFDLAALAEERAPAASEDAPRPEVQLPTTRRPMAPLEAAWVEGETIYGLRDGALWRNDEEGEERVLATQDALRAERCGSWLALGGPRQERLFVRAGASEWTARGTISSGERSELVCAEEHAALVVQAGGVIRVLRCDGGGCQAHRLGPLKPLTGAAHWAAVALPQVVLVAVGVSAAAPQLRVFRVRDGVEVHRPAACWSVEEEFCRKPFLGATGGRAVLAARDGTDLVAVETSDGRRWRPLRGLR